MRILFLTHAHLNSSGLSPVSCERADSFAKVWSEKYKWEIEIIHTSATDWVGPWPGGKGLSLINIVKIKPPKSLRKQIKPLYTEVAKRFIGRKKYINLLKFSCQKLIERARYSLSKSGLLVSRDLKEGRTWGKIIHRNITKKYDLIFVSFGSGDEYLLATAYELQKRLGIPKVLDFRDLWSDHHEHGKFSLKQKKTIRKMEEKMLANTLIASAPQEVMIDLLKKAHPDIDAIHIPHAPFIDKNWPDGSEVRRAQSKFTLLYAGKLYHKSRGYSLYLDTIKRLLALHANEYTFKFFVDDPEFLKNDLAQIKNSDFEINGWIKPGELWQHLREADLLVVYDPGIKENYPMVSTKSYLYAHTGNLILFLNDHKNDAVDDFVKQHLCGLSTSNIEDAYEYIIEQKQQRKLKLPALRIMPDRLEQAAVLGKAIQKSYNKIKCAGYSG